MNKLVWWGWWEISRYKQSSQLIFTKKNKFIRSIICQRSSSWKCVTHANASANIFINWSLIGDIISSSMIGSISSNTPPAAQSLVWNIAMQKNTVWDGKNENPSGSWDIGLIFGLQNSFYFLKNMFASFPGAIRNGSKPMAAFFWGTTNLHWIFDPSFWSTTISPLKNAAEACQNIENHRERCSKVWARLGLVHLLFICSHLHLQRLLQPQKAPKICVWILKMVTWSVAMVKVNIDSID